MLPNNFDEMVKAMLLYKKNGQSVYSYGLEIKERTTELVQNIKEKIVLTNKWKLPKWYTKYSKILKHLLLDDNEIDMLCLYHECGIPFNEPSYKVWNHVTNEKDVGYLIKHCNAFFKSSIKKTLTDCWYDDKFSLLIFSLAKIHVDNTFEKNWHKINRKGMWLCEYYECIPNEEFKIDIKKDDVQYLWHFNYYDYPRSGMCLYKDKKCWFEIDREVSYIYQVFKLYEMSEEEIAKEEYWHNIFKKYVGTHSDYQEKRIMRPQEMWKNYYKLAENRKSPNYKQNEIIGCYGCSLKEGKGK